MNNREWEIGQSPVQHHCLQYRLVVEQQLSTTAEIDWPERKPSVIVVVMAAMTIAGIW